MADGSASTFHAGQTGLIVRIPEAEPSVRGWRERLDPSAQAGIPAHVTVLFPFLDESRTDSLVHSALADVLGSHYQAFDLQFERCGRLPEVLYLGGIGVLATVRATPARADQCWSKTYPCPSPVGQAKIRKSPHLPTVIPVVSSLATVNSRRHGVLQVRHKTS